MQKLIKHIFDFLFALICSVFAIPIILIAMLIIHFRSPEAPTIFKQTRIGYRGKKFTIYKLRTMTDERDENGELLPDEQRLKRWGEVLRTLNVDELPQILNILSGQMSWIGPRPLLPHEMSVMTLDEQKLRQSMLPGITGWEAVNESKSDSREQMAQYDLYYVSNWSLWLDLKIFWKTVSILFTKSRAEDSYRAPKVKEHEIKTDEVYSEK
ncbi:MAG: sugar transferase [Clostridia bacterium]|nr:sugar transferase [Clostridia bacterium]